MFKRRNRVNGVNTIWQRAAGEILKATASVMEGVAVTVS